MVADNFLDLGQRCSKGVEIAFDEPGCEPHDKESAKVRSRRCREWRQGLESFCLARAMHPFRAGIRHEENSPALRKIVPHDERGSSVSCPAAAVDDEAAVLEC